MTPIERAAQAMHASAQPEWLWDDPDYPQLRAIYRDAARAMIASLREPSDAMFQAGLHPPLPNEVGAVPPLNIWQAMIDAALEEG